MGQPNADCSLSFLLPIRSSSFRLSSTACVWPEIRRDDIVESFRLSVIGFIARRNYTTPKAEQAPLGAYSPDFSKFFSIFLMRGRNRTLSPYFANSISDSASALFLALRVECWMAVMTGLSFTTPYSGTITTSSPVDGLIIPPSSGKVNPSPGRTQGGLTFTPFELDMPTLPRITLGLGPKCLYPGIEGSRVRQ